MRKAINDSDPLEGALLALCGVASSYITQQLPTQSHAEQRAAIRTSPQLGQRAHAETSESVTARTHTHHTPIPCLVYAPFCACKHPPSPPCVRKLPPVYRAEVGRYCIQVYRSPYIDYLYQTWESLYLQL